MITDILEVMEKGNRIALVGCTKIGMQLALGIKKIFPSINILFMDNDTEKQSCLFSKCQVVPVENLRSVSMYIICSIKYCNELEKQLLALDVHDQQIYFAYEVLEYKYNRERSVVNKRIPKKDLNIVIDLAEHCNLNCQSCDHFSPLASPVFTNIEEFESDINRLAYLLNDSPRRITHIDLEGGEPLLNPESWRYIEIVKTILPETQIKIFTNGILLTKQEKIFWEVCKKCDVVLEITKYPIKFEYDMVEKIAQNHGVRMEYYSGGETIKDSSRKPLNLKGNSDKYDSFHNCYMGNGECTMLKHGRIYPCTLIPNLSTFNDYFGQNIQVCDRDSIDIYQCESADEILEFLANPVPACRYCQPTKWTHGHKWATTKYKLSEWADTEGK